MTKENVISKIQKCLELAANNPSAAEAASAAAMAQRLMAKHNIEMTDISTTDVEEEIAKVSSDPIKACKWKYRLGSAIAQNFRCEMYILGSDRVVFYGRQTDANICKEVFMALFKLGHKLGLKARRDHKKLYGHGDNIYNSFVLGYVSGIKSILDEQCTALAIVIQPEVKEAFAEMSANMGTKKTGFNNPIHGNIHDRGVREGQDAMRGNQSNQIEG